MNDPTVDARGITGTTPLYRLANFNIIFDVVMDEFHLCKEGLAKLMLKRMFEDSTAVECRNIYHEWNNAYQATSVLSEIPRCARNISTGKLKGSELTVLIHSTFPFLIKVMQQGTYKYW